MIDHLAGRPAVDLIVAAALALLALFALIRTKTHHHDKEHPPMDRHTGAAKPESQIKPMVREALNEVGPGGSISRGALKRRVEWLMATSSSSTFRHSRSAPTGGFVSNGISECLRRWEREGLLRRGDDPRRGPVVFLSDSWGQPRPPMPHAYPAPGATDPGRPYVVVDADGQVVADGLTAGEAADHLAREEVGR